MTAIAAEVLTASDLSQRAYEATINPAVKPADRRRAVQDAVDAYQQEITAREVPDAPST